MTKQTTTKTSVETTGLEEITKSSRNGVKKSPTCERERETTALRVSFFFLPMFTSYMSYNFSG